MQFNKKFKLSVILESAQVILKNWCSIKFIAIICIFLMHILNAEYLAYFRLVTWYMGSGLRSKKVARLRAQRSASFWYFLMCLAYQLFCPWGETSTPKILLNWALFVEIKDLNVIRGKFPMTSIIRTARYRNTTNRWGLVTIWYYIWLCAACGMTMNNQVMRMISISNHEN